MKGTRVRNGRGGRPLDGLVLLLCLLGAVLAACSAEPPGPVPAKVQAKWTVARSSPAHRAHLERGLECGDCHVVADGQFQLPVAAVCDTCHQEVPLHHGDERRASDCARCHDFSGEVESPAVAFDLGIDAPDAFYREPEDCLDCHDDEQGSHKAVVVHADQRCVDCHTPHGTAALDAPSCTSCHQNVELHHGARSSSERPVHQQCLDCHTPHGPASDVGDACMTCHGSEKPVIPKTATFADGHTSCAGCHQNHDLRQAAASSCHGCHEGHAALGAAVVPQHRDCTSCHNPHDVKVGAQRACAGCHSNVHTDHPAVAGAAAACVNCHKPHPTSSRGAKAGPAPCSSCHKEPAHEGGHGGPNLDCTECHEPHAFGASVREPSLCSECHRPQSSAAHQNAGHQDCKGCHAGLPHHPGAGSPDCAKCHQSEAHATAHHQACTTCHEPHRGAQEQACKSCHAKEHGTAPSGHAACTACHDPHGQNPRKPTRECADCHRAQADRNPHRALATGCASCHRPHGGSLGHQPPGPAQPPSCTSCHKQGTLPGLHAEQGHSTCTSCHSPHDSAARRDRAACTSCHKEQVDHQAGAQNCASCHLFRGGF